MVCLGLGGEPGTKRKHCVFTILVGGFVVIDMDGMQSI